MNRISGYKYTLAFIMLVVAAGSAQAATVFVASNGTDSLTCGSGPNPPCRSINQAIANAVPGDMVRVGPGRYSAANEPSNGPCGCLILIDKALRIEASEGAGGTVLDASGLDHGVCIESDGVTLGLDHKGFTIVNAQLTGVQSIGNNDVEVHSNRVIGTECGPGFALAGVDVVATYNESHCNQGSGFEVPVPLCYRTLDICVEQHAAVACAASACNGLSVKLLGNQAVGNEEDGFTIATGVVELESNLASGNAGNGFAASGNNLKFKFNAATGNGGDGFNAPAGSAHYYDRNVASGNGTAGFYLAGSGHTVEQNAVLGNSTAGIEVLATGVVITKSNIHGNDPTTNCGIRNASGAILSAIKNYWGAPGGPGPDPADTTCGANPTTTTPFLSGPTLVPYTTGAGGSP